MAIINYLVYVIMLVEAALVVFYLVKLPHFLHNLLAQGIRALQQIQYVKYSVLAAALLEIVVFFDGFLGARHARHAVRAGGPAVDSHLARMFRSQRNMYIAGFALFLLFVVWRLTSLFAKNDIVPKDKPDEPKKEVEKKDEKKEN